jgi:hypothetical protein
MTGDKWRLEELAPKISKSGLAKNFLQFACLVRKEMPVAISSKLKMLEASGITQTLIAGQIAAKVTPVWGSHDELPT